MFSATKVQLPQKAKQIAAGFCTSGVVDVTGDVYVWGSKEGQDGKEPEAEEMIPVKVKTVEDGFFVDVKYDKIALAGYSLIASVKPPRLGVVRRGGGVRADSVGGIDRGVGRPNRPRRVDFKGVNKKLLHSSVLTKAVAGGRAQMSACGSLKALNMGGK